MKWPVSRPVARPATCGHSSAPSAAAASDSAISSRQRSGAASTWSRAKVTGRPIGGREPAHPVHLLGRRDDVLAGRTRRGQLEHAGAELAERGADAEQLVLGRERAGHGLAVDGRVGDGARRREPERAGRDRLLDDGLHRLRCPRGSPARCARRARPSRRPAPRRARSACRRRSVQRRASSASRYSGKLSQPQVDALGQGGAGDVLDALHQADQPVVLVGPGRVRSPTPQLPITRVVTPCQAVGASTSSQVAWPS